MRFRLARDTVGVMVIKALSMALGFVVSVVLARLLGVREFGLYSLAMSVLGLLVVPATFGFPQLLVREIAAYRVKSEWGLIRGLLRFAGRTSLLASISIALLGGLVLWLLSNRFSGETARVLALAFVALPFWALLQLHGAALRGFERIIEGQLVAMVLRPLCFLVLLGGAWFAARELLSAPFALSLQVVAAGVALLVGFLLLRGQLEHRAPEANPALEAALPQTSVWLRNALTLLLLSLLNFIPQHVGIILLGAMRGAEEVGLYRVAFQLASFVHFGLTIVNPTIGPILSRLHTLKDESHLRRLVMVSTLIVLLVGSFLAVFFLVIGESFLGLVFGSEYTKAYPALAVLSIGFLINAAAGVLWHLMIMSRREHLILMILLISVLIYLVLNIVTIPRWGYLGAALTQSFTLTVTAVLVFIAFKTKMR